ncbi:FUSC family protein [Lactiplantibacillus fabifermentans]|uniref:Integral membrane bound transporter domain-containing protein n=2 Tax=Lactiplantibacillus fabifermentans TaxID=483011 RepID=A0A0R2NTS0_9LACO|nr:FUSC family protein [Lactiplantibacillus fabifermentans]ETY73031.1 hypothetical protein LFAB_14645 [Lactiplantibacillus fabifermentans T30PCM01]KRO29061.1 hypothetical protein DY78_GL001469 [Lactiplantibacillus fabifermentans DSM 21115]
MQTYALMQLNPGMLRKKIHETHQWPQKWAFIWALLLRDTALLSFAIAYIASFTLIFGAASSYVGVATFCMLLSFRFVSYNYNVYESLGALAGILSLTWVNSMWLPQLGPLAALVVNFSSLLVILRLTSDTPLLGNGGVYTFGYVLVTGMPVGHAAAINRGWAFLAAFVICGWALWKHHRTTNQQVHVWWVFKFRGLHDATFRWQLRLATGVSAALLIGQLLNNGRAMWLGFASMSVLLPTTKLLRGRASLRFSGVVVGSLAFAGLLQIMPNSLIGILAPIAGLALGLTPSYFWASVFNCFGALTIAYTLFGIWPAVGLRLLNNGLGIICALIVAASLDWLWRHYQCGPTGE